MTETIGPNMGSDTETGHVDTAIATAASKHWLTESDSILRMTLAGQEQFRQGADVQRALAQQRMQGIADAEFATTITVLQRTIANVGGKAGTGNEPQDTQPARAGASVGSSCAPPTPSGRPSRR